MADPVTLMTISTALSVGTSLMQGAAASAAGKFEAKQLEQGAKARYAAGTREAQERRRQGEIVSSKARAVQAASGGVTTDPGAVEQLGGIESESEYGALAALYEASTESEGMKLQAKARRRAGKQAATATGMKALTTALGYGATRGAGGGGLSPGTPGAVSPGNYGRYTSPGYVSPRGSF